MTWRVESRR